jgi:hypothetical protein
MINRFLVYLIFLAVVAMAGSFLIYNFYQARLESENFDWQENSFQSRQAIP